MKKLKVAPGIFWVEIPEAGLYIQCGCPADSVKHLKQKGLIAEEDKGDGIICETGPNVILLSDVPMQHGEVANLGEFSVLQMLYRQGMILPGHPNNTGIKPLLLGIEDQIKAQAEYIYRGNYGLVSPEEIMQAGIPEEQAREMMRVKLNFAFGRIKGTEELIDTIAVGEAPSEIRNGVFIERKDINIYDISCKNEKVQVNLNLASHEEYEAPYNLNYHKIRREYFSVIHNGEGDGWDVNRPCMGSIIVFQGKIYLIDAGPNILYNLQVLGIGVNEIEGIFHTHSHDDHFAGLNVLALADHRIKYYSTRLVRLAVMKKLDALTSIDETLFKKYFEVHDLVEDVWNNVEGLEVKPVYSPHPVETCVLFFRALWGNGYESYAHLADIASLDLIKRMVNRKGEQNGISAGYYDKVKDAYLTPVHLKKIDIGGGMIHGNADDFKDDSSEKILLSHTALSLSNAEKEIGNNTSFGAVDVMIPTQQDYSKRLFYQYFQSYFPLVPQHEINMLLSCPVAAFNPGSILIKKNEKNRDVFFVLSGLLDYIDHDGGVNNKLTVGSMAGESSGMLDRPSKGTYRALSYVNALQVPCNLYKKFLTRNGIFDDFKINVSERDYLQNTWLFGERVSCPQKSRIAQSMKTVRFNPGDTPPVTRENGLYLLFEGKAAVLSNDKTIDYVEPGGFFGVEKIVDPLADIFTVQITEPSGTYWIPAIMIENIPIVHWKLLGVYRTLLLRGARLDAAVD